MTAAEDWTKENYPDGIIEPSDYKGEMATFAAASAYGQKAFEAGERHAEQRIREAANDRLAMMSCTCLKILEQIINEGAK